MKAAQILESGLAGAATLTLLSETLSKIDPNAPHTNPFHKTGIIRHIQKNVHKKGFKAVKMYVKLAAELLSVAGLLGLSNLGKKKNAVLRGGLLGGLAGLGVAFLLNKADDKMPNDLWKKRIVTIALYIIGGLVAGKAVQVISRKKKK